jgi:hypothetical protein
MHAHTNHLFLYVIWSFQGNYMKQSLMGSAMQWWSSETVCCSPSLQLGVTTGYIMGINSACVHITRHTNSWCKRQRQSLQCWMHIPLHMLIAQDFTKFVSRWQFKAYIYRYNPKHLYPKLNGYGDNGQRKVWSSLGFHSLYLTADTLSLSSHWVCFHIPPTQLTLAVLCICTYFRVTSALGRHA